MELMFAEGTLNVTLPSLEESRVVAVEVEEAVVEVVAVVRGDLVMDVVRTVVVISTDYLLLVLRRTE